MCAGLRRLAAAVGVAVLLVGGCAANPEHPASHAPAAAFDELAAGIPATVGIAFAAVGQNNVSTLGAWSSGVAWSTIKVPLAMAALRAEVADAEALIATTITASDNAAAEQLWSELGSPSLAARRVQDILAEGGDTGTVVESRRLRPGFTAFGQTQWSLARQAQFAARLPCIAGAGPVIGLMRNLVDEQRWGLATGGTPAKGGWGPGRSGGYLVRQFGVMQTHGGLLGVALAAEPEDGTFESGVRALNQMTDWTAKHRRELPGGRCTR